LSSLSISIVSTADIPVIMDFSNCQRSGNSVGVQFEAALSDAL
jgi:hypothetical protein